MLYIIATLSILIALLTLVYKQSLHCIPFAVQGQAIYRHVLTVLYSCLLINESRNYWSACTRKAILY